MNIFEALRSVREEDVKKQKDELNEGKDESSEDEDEEEDETGKKSEEDEDDEKEDEDDLDESATQRNRRREQQGYTNDALKTIEDYEPYRGEAVEVTVEQFCTDLGKSLLEDAPVYKCMDCGQHFVLEMMSCCGKLPSLVGYATLEEGGDLEESLYEGAMTPAIRDGKQVKVKVKKKHRRKQIQSAKQKAAFKQMLRDPATKKKREKSHAIGVKKGLYKEAVADVKVKSGEFGIILVAEGLKISLGRHLAEAQIHLATMKAKQVETGSQQYRKLLGEGQEVTFTVDTEMLERVVEKKSK